MIGLAALAGHRLSTREPSLCSAAPPAHCRIALKKPIMLVGGAGVVSAVAACLFHCAAPDIDLQGQRRNVSA